MPESLENRGLVRFAALLCSGLLCCVVHSASALTISGTVLYSGTQTGAWFRVLASTNATAWSGSIATNVPAGPFTLDGVVSGETYWVRAFLDSDADQVRDLTEPIGSHRAGALAVSGNVVGLVVDVRDTWFDFEGWSTSQDWLILDPGDSVFYRGQRWTGSNYSFSIVSSGTGGEAFQSAVGSNGNAVIAWRLAKGTGDIYHAFNRVPTPGRFYRITFDARCDKINKLLRVYWYNATYISGNPVLNNMHSYYKEGVLLGTNWQTFTYDAYFDHDDQFVRFGSAGSQAPFFELLTLMDENCIYQFDNMSMTEYQPSMAVRELENRGFERGFYGWTDESRWSQRGVGDPFTELTNAPHWRVSTNQPHSGKYCMEIELPAFTNAHWTFEPALVTGSPYLKRGGHYMLSYWQSWEGAATHFVRVNDIYSRRHSRMVLNEGVTSGWTRVVLPMWRYAEYQQNTNFIANPGTQPNGDYPVRIQLGSVHYPWARKLRIDDVELREVTEAEARNIVTNGYQVAPAPVPVAETNDAYFLSTTLAASHPTRRLLPTEALQVPVVVLPGSGAAGSGTAVIRVQDFLGRVVCTQQVPFDVSGGTFSGVVAVTTFPTNGFLPEGLYNYVITAPGVTNTASDRFFVSAVSTALQAMASPGGVLGFDRFDLNTPMNATTLQATAEFGAFDAGVYMQQFKDLGGRIIKLWVLGRSTNEIDILEPVVDLLITNGFEPFVALVGLASPTNAYSIYTRWEFEQNWSASEWTQFVTDMATRFDGKVRRWEVANEPYDFTPESYLALLSNTWTSLRAVNTNNLVHAFDQILAETTLPMISNTYALGAAPFIDVVDYHCYHPESEQEETLRNLMNTVRIFEGAVTNNTAGGAYLGVSNTPVWMAEYTPLWAKIAQGNLVSSGEVTWAVTVLTKMLMAKAFDVERFIVFNCRPSAIDNSIFAIPLHSPGTYPAPCLIFAGGATFAKKLTGRNLKTAFVRNNLYAFGFGPEAGTNTDVVATWCNGRHPPEYVAAGVPDFRMTRMDGSFLITNALAVYEHPVFLESLSGTYDWTQVFGTNQVRVR